MTCRQKKKTIETACVLDEQLQRYTIIAVSSDATTERWFVVIVHLKFATERIRLA